MSKYRPYAGEASIRPYGNDYFTVQIQAYNVTAEVYIDRQNAEELRDRLELLLGQNPELTRTVKSVRP